MAVNFPNFLNAPSAESPWKNALESVLKGYQMQREPAKMEEEQKQRELANKLRGLELEHKPKQYALDDQGKSLANALHSKALEHYEEKYGQEKALREANIRKANQPQTLKGALAAAFQLRNTLDPNDPNYEKDKSAINNYINNLGQKNGVMANMAPGEGIKINLPEGKEGYITGLGKLKSGWVPVNDAQGNVIGVNVPMDANQIKEWKAKEKFDVIYPFMNESLSEYSGGGSWEKFLQDVKNYRADPAAQDRIDNFLAAKRLLSIGTTTENARIGGHATNVQLRDLKEKLDASEVHKRLEQGSQITLPRGYAKKSGDIFKSYLDQVELAAKNDVPAYEFRPLNPGQKTQSAQSVPLTSNSQSSSVAEPGAVMPRILGTQNGITTIKHAGKFYRMPEKLVDKFVQENSPPAFGGEYGQ